jgi:hypothetical protein
MADNNDPEVTRTPFVALQAGSLVERVVLSPPIDVCQEWPFSGMAPPVQPDCHHRMNAEAPEPPPAQLRTPWMLLK